MRYVLIALLAVFAAHSAMALGQQGARPVQVSVVLAPDPEGRADLMRYNRNRPLKIEDFRGRPDKRSQGVAATRSGIEMSYSGTEYPDRIEVTVTMYAYFEPGKSWMKAEGQNARVLNHEQGHLDLTAIYLCKMKTRIEQQTYNPLTWGNAIKALYHKVTVELGRAQEAYDRETQHGTLPDVQKVYDERFRKALQEPDSCY